MSRISPELLPGIAALIQVIDSGSLTAAARELGLTPSGVSKQLARLEQRLGVRVLARTTRSTKPTEAGIALYTRCRHLFDALGEAEDAVREMRGALSGKIRITATPAFGRAHLLPALSEFAREHDALVFDVTLSAGRLDLVEDGLDLAIREGELPDSSMVATKLADASIFFCAAPRYLARVTAPRTLRDLSEHDLVTVPVGGAGGNVAQFVLPRGGRLELTPRFQVNDLYCVRQLALDGVGIAALPSYMTGEDLAEGRLIRVLQAEPLPTLPIAALTADRLFQPAKVRALLDFLVLRLRGSSITS